MKFFCERNNCLSPCQEKEYCDTAKIVLYGMRMIRKSIYTIPTIDLVFSENFKMNEFPIITTSNKYLI